jgi:hypothetical protein
MENEMTQPNGWTDSWLSDVMRDDALDASYHRRDIDADRGVSARADSDKAREVVASLYEALSEVIPFAEKFINDNHPAMQKARAALSAAEGGE